MGQLDQNPAVDQSAAKGMDRRTVIRTVGAIGVGHGVGRARHLASHVTGDLGGQRHERLMEENLRCRHRRKQQHRPTPPTRQRHCGQGHRDRED